MSLRPTGVLTKNERSSVAIGPFPFDEPELNFSRTPIVDALDKINRNPPLSFHALPLSQYESETAIPWLNSFGKVRNQFFTKYDKTYVGDLFDVPAFPTKCIKRSTEITAEVFGADYTSYITVGTTIANQIAVFSLVDENDRVLVDRSCHQSIHFGLMRNRNRVNFIPGELQEKESGRRFFGGEAMLQEIKLAKEANDPYKLLVLNGCSYEGVLKNEKEIFQKVLEIDDRIAFLVDEAWIAFGYFHPYYEPFCALKAARSLGLNHSNCRIIVTQSAHKTLNALRQASYLHLIGPQHLWHRIKETQFMLHTTSPSYPILASLELARRDAEIYGSQRTEKLFHLREVLKKMLETQNFSAPVFFNQSESYCDNFQQIDPLKVSINISNIANSVGEAKKTLLEKHSIYFGHYTETSILAAIHYAITEEKIRRLVRALLSLNEPKETEICNKFVIPYPPGVPLLMPGDRITPSVLNQIENLRANGVKIIELYGESSNDSSRHHPSKSKEI